MNTWKTGDPKKKGRYFCLADFREPIKMGSLGVVTRQNVPIVSNYTPEEGWANALDEITITHWMEVPELKTEKFQFIQIDLTKPPEYPDPLFKVDDDGVTLKWGRYDYFIEWKRLRTQGDVLRWLCHIGEKEWEEATSYRIGEFIQAVCKKRGWNLHPLP